MMEASSSPHIYILIQLLLQATYFAAIILFCLEDYSSSTLAAADAQQDQTELQNLNYLEKVHPYHTLFQDGFPSVVYDDNQSPSGIVCLIEKCWSTVWKEVFLKGALNLTNAADITERVHFYTMQDIKPPLKVPSNAELDRMDRFIIVRNPYARLLSGWLDKRVVWREEVKFWPPPYSPLLREANTPPSPVEFAEFVHALVSTPPESVNSHFRPISNHCWLSQGFTFDFVLKVELLDEWYEMFISRLNLFRTVLSGWEGAGSTSQECHYVPSHRNGCKSLFTSFSTTGSNVFNIVHHEGSTSRTTEKLEITKDSVSGRPIHHSELLLKMFYDEETVKLVNKYFEIDFKKFHYPLWDHSNTKTNQSYSLV